MVRRAIHGWNLCYKIVPNKSSIVSPKLNSLVVSGQSSSQKIE